MTDAKWPEYRDFSDVLYFAVDADFPQALLPEDVGLIVAADQEAVMLREAPLHRAGGRAPAGADAAVRDPGGVQAGEFERPAGSFCVELRVARASA